MISVSDLSKTPACSILVACCLTASNACNGDNGFIEPQNKAPSSPSAPSPVHNATDVAATVTLTWEFPEVERERNAITFDVYFGEDVSPPKVDSALTGTTYDPGPLGYDTQYFWKIAAKNTQQELTEGPEWCFTTTSNQAPTTPVMLTPGNHAPDQLASVQLSWEPSTDPEGDDLMYDVYLGTVARPPMVGSNQTATSYDPETIDANTLYFWRVVARDDHGNESPGDLWRFTTRAATWKQMNSGTTASIRGVWGSSGDHVIAVGGTPGHVGEGKVFRWNGREWEDVHTTNAFLKGVWGTSSTNMWIVGDDGAIIHYDGWTFSPPVFPRGIVGPLNSVWGAPGEPASFVAVGDFGRILHYDGGTGVWSTVSRPTAVHLNDVWGTGTGSDPPFFGDVYAVSGGGVLHYGDHGSWTTVSLPWGVTLYRVWGSSGHVYAVGEVHTPFGGIGSVVHYDGTAWTLEHVHWGPVFAIWGTSPTNVYMKQHSALLYHNDGSGWNIVPGVVFQDNSYWDMWGASGTNIFIVGDDGLIYRYAAQE
jgi:hypothetical protein